MIWAARAEVIEVIDGDTFHANLDIGWGIMLRPRRKNLAAGQPRGLGTVRVLHPGGRPFDAPEIATHAGKRAATYARTLAAVGEHLEIASYEIDDFGRTLAAVKLGDGSDWATVMTEAGFVKVRP